MNRLILIFTVICSMIVFAENVSATIFQITNNDFNDAYPSLCDGTIAWRGDDGYSTNSVYYWGGGTSIQQLTQNGRYGGITVDNGNVYWNKDINHTSISDSYFWDGQETSYIFHSSYSDVDNGQVVTGRLDGTLTFWDNGLTESIHINDYINDYTLSQEMRQTKSDNGTLAWLDTNGTNGTIYYWDGSVTTEVCTGIDNYIPIFLDNGNITWVVGNSVYFWDGTSISVIATNVIFNTAPISNGNISWMGDSADNGREIYYWDGTEIRTISNNPYVDDAPSLYNNTIAWMGSDGNDLEIFYWDGGSLDERVVLDLDIQSFNDGNSGSSVPEPTTMVLFGLGILGLAGVSRKKTIV